MKGTCLVHRQIQKAPRFLDFTHLKAKGLTVLCRLNWGYADGTGTLPPPQHQNAFISATATTINNASGIDFFHVGNEPNNRSEWPSEHPLTPAYTIGIYNEIRSQTVAPLGPPPLDPYFGPGSNNMDWWLHFLEHATGADCFFLHLKTQTNDPADVWSKAKFSDPPLTWQYLNLRAGETHIERIPPKYQHLPIHVTECNPQHLTHSGGPLGWERDNAQWIYQAADYFRSLKASGTPIGCICFYRYLIAGDQAPFALEDKPALLEAIRNLEGETP